MRVSATMDCYYRRRCWGDPVKVLFKMGIVVTGDVIIDCLEQEQYSRSKDGTMD